MWGAPAAQNTAPPPCPQECQSQPHPDLRGWEGLPVWFTQQPQHDQPWAAAASGPRLSQVQYQGSALAQPRSPPAGLYWVPKTPSHHLRICQGRLQEFPGIGVLSASEWKKGTCWQVDPGGFSAWALCAPCRLRSPPLCGVPTCLLGLPSESFPS